MRATRPVFSVRAEVQKPRRRTKVTPNTVKMAIQHAKNLCYNFETTTECRAAWELVEEISDELDRQKEEDKYINGTSRDDADSLKMYD